MSNASAAPWRERLYLLAVIGVAVGLVARLIASRSAGDDVLGPALATFLIVGATMFALVVTRARPWLALGFAAAAGAVVAGVIALSGSPLGLGGDVFRLGAAVFAAAIAAPLVQARWFDGRPFSYAVVRDNTYANLIRFAAAWVFTGVAWGLAWLLAGLFALIGLEALSQLLGNDWVAVALVGGVNGAALGIMRDRDAGIGGLGDSAADALTPVFAFGLALFLLAIPVTGLAPLWAATKSTTPILLVAIVAAVRMIDSVAGGDRSNESRHRVVRIAGQVLCAAILPLAVIAWVSVRARTGQYGDTPERLWALTLSGIGCAAGAVYWYALSRRADVWAAVRRAHLWLMIGLTTLAVLLSTPLIGFGAMSARDQEARLLSGRVTPDKFDWHALYNDFGPAGRDAVARLRRSRNPAIAQGAAGAAQATRNDAVAASALPLRIVPATATLPLELERLIRSVGECDATARCTVLYQPQADTAISVAMTCDTCAVQTQRYVRNGSDWTAVRAGGPVAAQSAAVRASMATARIEVLRVERDQVFVDGQPVGDVLPPLPQPTRTP